MEKDGVYYVDHSILSTFDSCEEKARLLYKEHLRGKTGAPALDFGTAIHAGVAEYYNHVNQPDASIRAQVAFYKSAFGKLPMDANSTERRSVERGVYIMEKYIEKWRKTEAHWVDLINPSTDKPMVEIGGSLYFMDYKGKPVMYVFKIDRIRLNRIDNKAYNWETKSTVTSPKYYVAQTRPNHQITGYDWVAKELLHIDLAGTILDIIFVSDRKVDGKYPGGVDIENDFVRTETRRTPKDIEEFLFDLREGSERYLDLFTSEKRRWRRSAPGACNGFGGCWFRAACNSHLSPQIMSSEYETSIWHPWKDEKDKDATT